MDIVITEDYELNIKAWMLFPDKDDEYRRDWVSVMKSNVDVTKITLVADSSRRKPINTIMNERLVQGHTCGSELKVLFFDGDKAATKERVRKRMAETALADGLNVVTDSTYDKYAKRFRPVQHYWGAATSEKNLPPHLAANHANSAKPFGIEDINRFLYIAEDYRLFWKHHLSKMGRPAPDTAKFILK